MPGLARQWRSHLRRALENEPLDLQQTIRMAVSVKGLEEHSTLIPAGMDRGLLSLTDGQSGCHWEVDSWRALFFGLRNPALAFADIVLLWLALAATAVAFWRVGRLAGLLLVPYLGWVTFATALNFAVWQLNR